VTPFVKRLLVLDHELLHSFGFAFAQISFQAVQGQNVANRRQKDAQKEYLEREVLH
jgi:hypothetical protein